MLPRGDKLGCSSANAGKATSRLLPLSSSPEKHYDPHYIFWIVMQFPERGAGGRRRPSRNAVPERGGGREADGGGYENEDFGRFNLWRPGSCAIRRQHVAVGPADPTSSGVAQYCAQCSPAAAAKGARGACDCSPRPPWISFTPPNAVPWVRSEVDTFRSSQLLVVNGRRGGSN